MRILSSQGFQNFECILDQGISDSLYLVMFTDSSTIKVTGDHRFRTIDGEWCECEFLMEGDILYNNKTIHTIELIDNEDVYDFFEVSETNDYYTNGVISHNCNYVYIDEFAIIPNTVAEDFLTSTYPVLSSGLTTKIAITSTPLGMNHFWKMWNDSKTGNNDFVNFFAPWTAHPNRDEEWAKEQRRLLGCEIKFNQEVGCHFTGSSFTLISPEALMNLSHSIPFHSDGNLDVYEVPFTGEMDVEGKDWIVKPAVYAMIVDTSDGTGGDNSAFTIIRIDVLPYRVVAKYKNNLISPLLFPNVIHKWATSYNHAWILVEINKTEQVPHILNYELEYENIIWVSKKGVRGQVVTGGFASVNKNKPGVVMDKKVKRIGCDMLKTLVDEKKLYIPDADIISELSTFIRKGTSFQADDGHHDDLVMTLVIFGWLTSQQYFKELSNIDLRRSIYEARINAYLSESLPIGEFCNGIETINTDGWINV